MISLCLASREERKRRLLGDDLIPDAGVQSTHGVTIDASVDQVWPWIAQIGQGRGGFYSYSWLENLIGCQIKNANQIHPEWQHLDVGQQVMLHPKANPLIVVGFEPESCLLLMQRSPMRWTWGFYLLPNSTGNCRLLIRTRVGWNRGVTRLLLSPAISLGHYIMERKMLTGIRKRAERVRRP